jgi:diaminopimelate epimerase
LKFTKMHGAGNDYLFIDGRVEDRDWPALSVAMSDRHKGVGSDGIILAAQSDESDLQMIMFNADGSEGQMCGNGIRCVVRFAFDEGILPAGDSTLAVETASGVRHVTPIWEEGIMVRARVGMGEPKLRAEDVPVVVPGYEVVTDYPLQIDGYTMDISCVSMGNPHAVAFMEGDIDGLPLDKVGPLVEHHPMFPQRVNFEVVNLIDSSHVKTRVWERGSGLTEACGTGACAVAVSARLHGYVGDDVTVSLPGGDLAIHWPGEGEVIMEGPVAQVFEGEWPD